MERLIPQCIFKMAHVDTFCGKNLPPADRWPELRFDLPELTYSEQLNCATALLDDAVAKWGGERRCIVTPTER